MKRRKILSLAGVSIAATVAGCTGGQDDGGPVDEGEYDTSEEITAVFDEDCATA